MNREFKVGDWVIYTDKEISDWWKKHYDVSLYGKLAKIIYIDEYSDYENDYLLEFKEFIGSEHDGGGKGKKDHCKWGERNQIKLAINHLKFKKWIKG